MGRIFNIHAVTCIMQLRTAEGYSRAATRLYGGGQDAESGSYDASIFYLYLLVRAFERPARVCIVGSIVNGYAG